MKPIIVKIGGRPASNPVIVESLIKEISQLDTPVILVHGGGSAVSHLTETVGLTPRFKDGIRDTSKEEMVLVDAVLAGQVNKSLVRLFQAHGIRAVGICGCDGGTFLGKPVTEETHTGSPEIVDTSLLETLITSGYQTVVAPVSSTSEGFALNINADEAALALAGAFPACSLVFISDIPGILEGKKILKNLTPSEAEKAIENQIITGGMIPKVRASIDALKAGTGQVIIGGYEFKGDLQRLLEGKQGSHLTLENKEKK